MTGEYMTTTAAVGEVSPQMTSVSHRALQDSVRPWRVAVRTWSCRWLSPLVPTGTIPFTRSVASRGGREPTRESLDRYWPLSVDRAAPAPGCASNGFRKVIERDHDSQGVKAVHGRGQPRKDQPRPG
jgi:hypothetical protein